MNLLEAIAARHSVRTYTSQPLEDKMKRAIEQLIARSNEKSGLNFQLVTEEPKAFGSFLVHYGKFKGVRNYIVLAGGKGTEQACGYFGEKIVLEAQRLGLNTCWVALTFRKIHHAFTLREGDKVHCVIAIGYGETQGHGHKIKKLEEVASMEGTGAMPDWFVRGVQAALLAPTSINQQKFHFHLHGSEVEATETWGPYSTVDLGIVKCHFELGAGKEFWRKEFEIVSSAEEISQR